MMMGVGGAAAAAFSTITDTFTGTNGTDLTAHTTDTGQTWVGDLGTITISSNKAVPSNGTTRLNQYHIATSVSDVTIQADLNYDGSSTRYARLVARLTDTNNYWQLSISNQGSSMILYEVSSGTVTQRATSNQSMSAGTSYTIKLVCSGSTMTGYFSGLSVLSYSSATSNKTAKNHGIYLITDTSFLAGTISADNFSITSP